MEVSGQLQDPAALSPEKKPGARWSPDISEKGKKKPTEPTWIRTPNLAARSQRSVPTRLSAETLTAYLTL